jgi:hypothetical protein
MVVLVVMLMMIIMMTKICYKQTDLSAVCILILPWKRFAPYETRPLHTRWYHVISLTMHTTTNAYPNSKTQEATFMCVTLI